MFVFSISEPTDMSLTYNGNTSFTVTFGSQNQTQPGKRSELTVRAGDSSETCENITGSGFLKHSVSGLTSNTEYSVSGVSCYSPPDNCSVPIVKNVKTLPARTYITDVLLAPNCYNLEYFSWYKICILLLLAPKEVRVFGDSSEAVLMRVTQPSETPGITQYKAKSGSSTCEAAATDTPPQCLIFRLPSGTHVKVEIVACLADGTCSIPYVEYGFTYPKGSARSLLYIMP